MDNEEMMFKKGHIVTEETRKKISEGNKGSIRTKEARKKMSESHLGEKNHNYGKPPSEETRKKISEANKGKVRSEETRKKMSESHKGKSAWSKGLTKETDKRVKKLSETRKGHIVTEKTKEKISLANTGRFITEETRKKLSLSGIGHTVTEETRKKISEKQLGEKNWNYGKHLSEETKRKISFAERDWDFYNEHGCLKRNYPYNDCFTEEFKDMIRARDGNKCVVTGMTNEEHKAKYGMSLPVHHWTYDKDVTDPFYFVTVTCGINIAAETNRGEWIAMFNGSMEDKYCELIQ